MNVRIAVLVLLSATFALARKHRHLGPTDTESSSLYGRVASVAFRAELKKDVVLWDELQREGSSIISCHSHQYELVNVKMQVPNLDLSDYEVNTAFVISIDDWEKKCGKPEKIHAIDHEDPVLFFNIMHAIGKKTDPHFISVHMKMVSGSTVAPSFEVVPIPKNHPSAHIFPEFHLSAENFLNPRSTQLIDPGMPLQDPDVTDFSIFPGATVMTYANLDASVGRLTFKRSFSLEVEWEQSIRANISSLLTAVSAYRAFNVKAIYRKKLSDFSYSTKVPLLGTLELEAHKKMDLSQAISINEASKVFVSANHEDVLRVSAKFSSRELAIEKLLPPGFGSSGAGRIDFGEVASHNFGLDGFIGYHPGLELSLRLGSIKSYSAVIDFSVGLEASLTRQFPPFPPLQDSSGVSVGSCSKCHEFRLKSSVVGKNLQSKLFEDGKTEKEKVHDASLFKFDLATVCALSADCQ